MHSCYRTADIDLDHALAGLCLARRQVHLLSESYCCVSEYNTNIEGGRPPVPTSANERQRHVGETSSSKYKADTQRRGVNTGHETRPNNAFTKRQNTATMTMTAPKGCFTASNLRCVSCCLWFGFLPTGLPVDMAWVCLAAQKEKGLHHSRTLTPKVLLMTWAVFPPCRKTGKEVVGEQVRAGERRERLKRKSAAPGEGAAVDEEQ